MVFTLFKCVQQVTGTGKSESNYEEEKKRFEYRQTEYIMKIIIGGERSWLARGLVIQKKIVIWGCYLIEFGEFSPQKRNLPSTL